MNANVAEREREEEEGGERNRVSQASRKLSHFAFEWAPTVALVLFMLVCLHHDDDDDGDDDRVDNDDGATQCT